MQRCSYTSYRDGSWQSNATATAPYRLTRDLQTNAFVKGWAYGKGRFWGTCDEGFPETYTRPAVPVAGAQNKASKGRGRGKAAGGRGVRRKPSTRT